MSLRRRLVVKSDLNRAADKKVCLLFKWQLYAFIQEIDAMLRGKLSCNDIQCLTKMADAILDINLLSKNATGCGEDLALAAQLLQNMLNAPVASQATTLLEAAQHFKQHPDLAAPFAHVLHIFVQYQDEAQELLQTLRFIAYEM